MYIVLCVVCVCVCMVQTAHCGYCVGNSLEIRFGASASPPEK